ncbi:MAG: MerR family transcriptional regulator, partial [Actinomycetota bacterium]
MADGLMTIGMFSRASLLSVKALRAYHQAGILVPAEVDPRTGYRSYAPGQLADAGVILRLRRLDLPLAAVGRIMRARDPEITRAELAAHDRVMRARLDETRRIVTDLQSGTIRPTEHTPVHVREEPHCDALGFLTDVHRGVLGGADRPRLEVGHDPSGLVEARSHDLVVGCQLGP